MSIPETPLQLTIEFRSVFLNVFHGENIHNSHTFGTNLILFISCSGGAELLFGEKKMQVELPKDFQNKCTLKFHPL